MFFFLFQFLKLLSTKFSCTSNVMWLPLVEVTSTVAGMNDVLNMQIRCSVYVFVSFWFLPILN